MYQNLKELLKASLPGIFYRMCVLDAVYSVVHILCNAWVVGFTLSHPYLDDDVDMMSTCSKRSRWIVKCRYIPSNVCLRCLFCRWYSWQYMGYLFSASPFILLSYLSMVVCLSWHVLIFHWFWSPEDWVLFSAIGLPSTMMRPNGRVHHGPEVRRIHALSEISHPVASLSHSVTKWPPFYRRHFQMSFLQRKKVCISNEISLNNWR